MVGCPGSGKSTLALALAERTGLPVFHLDKIYHDPSHPYQDRHRWNQEITAIVNQPRWIIDGVHQTTYERRFSQGDLTIFLDLPLALCLYRIVYRWYYNRSRQRADMPVGFRDRLNPNFLLFVLMYPF